MSDKIMPLYLILEREYGRNKHQRECKNINLETTKMAWSAITALFLVIIAEGRDFSTYSEKQ